MMNFADNDNDCPFAKEWRATINFIHNYNDALARAHKLSTKCESDAAKHGVEIKDYLTEGGNHNG